MSLEGSECGRAYYRGLSGEGVEWDIRIGIDFADRDAAPEDTVLSRNGKELTKVQREGFRFVNVIVR